MSSQNGYNSETKTYHSLRPQSPLPPLSTKTSITHYILSLSTSTSSATSSLIDTSTTLISYTEIPRLVHNLTNSLRQPPLCLRQHSVAYVISPNSSHLPILYLSLFAAGVTVSPANPVSSVSEVERMMKLCRPSVVFATSDCVEKVVGAGFKGKVVVIDSVEFEDMMRGGGGGGKELMEVEVSQEDIAAILYSSGTTGKMKGVKLTHRNLISTIAGAFAGRQPRSSPAVYLSTVPYFHVYGFALCLRTIAFGDSLVSFARFNLRVMLRLIEEFGVTHMAVAPPVVVALVDENNKSLVEGVNWKSLETVYSGGAPITVAVIDKFKKRFPNVSLLQAYGLTETTGGVSRIAGPYESTIVGTVGRLIAHCEAKIVDPNTGVSS